MENKISPFIPREVKVKGQEHFDEYYITMRPKKVVKKTGEGEDDYVLVTKFVEEKQNIKELINSQSSEVGIYNLLDRVAKTGDESLLPKPHDDKNGVLTDITGYPEDLMEAHRIANAGADAFMTLPEELKKGRSLEEFAKNISDEEAAAFIKAFIAKRFAKKDDGKEEK